MTTPAKVLFIGIDAADKDLILQWAHSGHLPTFKRLLDTAAWGSTVNPLGLYVGAVWPSFYTGVSPARHSRYCYTQLRPGSYETYSVRPTHVRAEPFWDALSRAGKRVAVIDVPKTHPSQEINGIHLVDWAAHDGVSDEAVSSPASLAAEVTARFGRDPVGDCNADERTAADFVQLRDALVARAANKAELCSHFLAQGPWDCFAAVFAESHCIGHQCWHVHDAHHPRHDPEVARVVGDPIKDVYAALDTAVGRLLEQAGSQARAIVLASHGMGPHYDASFFLDEILQRLESGGRRKSLKDYRAVKWAWERLPRFARRRLRLLTNPTLTRLKLHPFSHRKCFQIPNNDVYGGIRINLVGREPTGCITPGAEQDAYCEALSRDLLELVNVDTGRPVVNNVLRTDRHYQGPYLDHLPDLLVEWNREAPIAAVHSRKTGEVRGIYKKCRTGDHTCEGLFFITGPSVRPGQADAPVSILDFAPTFARLLDVNLPQAEGKPITSLIGVH
jgi:predicted AlkP superfamily phosphohydrolase/phosphomutase